MRTLVPLLIAASFSCKGEQAQSGAVDAKLPIVVYYTLPG
jgi:hypothetical protein